MIFPKLFFLLCSFQLPPCTLFHPMLLSCEGGAAKLFLSRAIVRNARRPQKQKNSLSTLCFSFPGCVCRASEEKKKEKRMISASYMRFYFFGVFFSIRLLEQILLHMDRDRPFFFLRPTFLFSCSDRSTMGGGELSLLFLRRRASSSSSVLPWCVVGRNLKERKTRKKRKQKKKTQHDFDVGEKF